MSSLRTRITGPLLLLATLATGAQSVALDEPETTRHQGIWQAVSFVYDGTETSNDIVETITRTVEGDHVAWKRSGKNFAGTTFKVDPSQDPKTIEITPDGGPNRDKPSLGIYKLEGDDLSLCMAAAGKERPKTFEAPKGSGLTLMKFRRVK